MRYLKLAATAVVVAVLTACGGNAEPAAAPPPPNEVTDPAPPIEETEPSAEAPQVDACALVTKADAEKLAGTPLEDPVPVRETCRYTGPVSGPVAQVEVYVGDGAKKILDVDRDLDHEFETLSGIGDEAYLEDGAVFVHAAGVWVAIRLVRLDDPARYHKPLTELARTVADRL
ncbi:hypothetical protein GCM10029963_22870 [Micromonospora andamanensis]|uniref:hypothetical protein n=1 Tax=Micromonospora andamanensis TaxID=1287068 RepID=UPI00194E7AE1|nr:hypothetical protein [Micromonospora andamanensis]GIJ41638.1 hypothetical protein Vwe01_49630 [Micromonospora andamanensis]